MLMVIMVAWLSWDVCFCQLLVNIGCSCGGQLLPAWKKSRIGDQANWEHGLVIPKPLKVHAVKWYHHYLHHPGHTRLQETMNAAMYWKGMHTTIRSLTKSCRSCQINKRWSCKYGHLPPKTVITNPWECLCVGLIGPYTLKGKGNLQIDFMALTMIDPTYAGVRSWNCL